jgi:hypothetical protein
MMKVVNTWMKKWKRMRVIRSKSLKKANNYLLKVEWKIKRLTILQTISYCSN